MVKERRVTFCAQDVLCSAGRAEMLVVDTKKPRACESRASHPKPEDTEVRALFTAGLRHHYPDKQSFTLDHTNMSLEWLDVPQQHEGSVDDAWLCPDFTFRLLSHCGGDLNALSREHVKTEFGQSPGRLSLQECKDVRRNMRDRLLR